MDTGRQVIFQCEDSTDGIFTAVYDAWDSHVGHRNVKLEAGGGNDPELFSEYRKVVTDSGKAEKVARTLRHRLSEEAYEHIYNATLAKDADKAVHIYRTIVLGLTVKDGRNIMDCLGDVSVRRVFECSRRAGHEAHMYTGFLRFTELKNKVLYAQIEPENQVLPLIGEHFADRFPEENFLIYDKRHQNFIAHAAKGPWILVWGEAPDEKAVREVSDEECRYQELWKAFHRTIAIKERTNLGLQRQMLPLRYRKNMTEWQEETGSGS